MHPRAELPQLPTAQMSRVQTFIRLAESRFAGVNDGRNRDKAEFPIRIALTAHGYRLEGDFFEKPTLAPAILNQLLKDFDQPCSVSKERHRMLQITEQNVILRCNRCAKSKKYPVVRAAR